MKSVRLIFKKVGNHWYLDIPHSNPNDLRLDRRIEFVLNKLDKFNEGIVNNIWLYEQSMFIEPEGLIQFDDADLTRYFTTNDDFILNLYIDKYNFTISSNLYGLIELYYQLNLHELVYRVVINEI